MVETTEQRGERLADFLAESSYLRCAWTEPEYPAEVASLILQFLGLDPSQPLRSTSRDSEHKPGCPALDPEKDTDCDAILAPFRAILDRSSEACTCADSRWRECPRHPSEAHRG